MPSKANVTQIYLRFELEETKMSVCSFLFLFRGRNRTGKFMHVVCVRRAYVRRTVMPTCFSARFAMATQKKKKATGTNKQQQQITPVPRILFMCTWLKFGIRDVYGLCVCVWRAHEQHEEVVDVISSRPWLHNKFDLEMIGRSKTQMGIGRTRRYKYVYELKQKVRTFKGKHIFHSAARLYPVTIIQICFARIPIHVFVSYSIFRMQKFRNAAVRRNICTTYGIRCKRHIKCVIYDVTEFTRSSTLVFRWLTLRRSTVGRIIYWIKATLPLQWSVFAVSDFFLIGTCVRCTHSWRNNMSTVRTDRGHKSEKIIAMNSTRLQWRTGWECSERERDSEGSYMAHV